LESANEVFFLSELTEEERIKEGLDKWGHVFVAQSLSESEKVGGLEPEVADALFNRGWCDYQLVEADGAAQRPLKAPAAHEPVYPGTCSRVVAMAGLEVLGKPLEPDLVFRIEKFQEVTGVRPGEKISCEVLARLFLSQHGAFRGAPAGAVRVVFLNKLDLLGGNGEMNNLADLILSAPESPIDRVILGSILKGNYRVISKSHGSDLS
jgi:probable selenium-dependent hydroxylase accessory protein YqeC